MFLSQEHDTRRLPVVLVSGFLGSGKTTLINAALSDPRMADTAVAVNEFGAVPLDHHLIDQGQDRTVLLGNGCLCCNLAGDLEDAVMRVFARRHAGELPAFRRLIIEPSGLADPTPIAQAILRNPVLSKVLRLATIVTTVDAVFGEQQSLRDPEFRAQVALADRVVLTKTDIADPDAVANIRASIARFNPVASTITVNQGAVDLMELFPASFVDPAQTDGAVLSATDAGSSESALPTGHADRATSISLLAHEPLRWKAVDAWLRKIRIEHAAQLLRIKGLLNLAEASGPVVIQGIHHVLHPPVELKCWPDADRRTRLVAILEGVRRDVIAASWASALPGMQAGGSHAG